jgi:para-aminobenzoate synthetase component I
MLTAVAPTTTTVHELAGDVPLRRLAPALAHLPGLALLEGDQTGFGYLTADPFDRFRWRSGGGESTLAGPLAPSGFAALSAWLAPYQAETLPHLPPFQGGAIGQINYEAGYALDRVRGARVPVGDDLARFHLYDWVVARDNAAGRNWLICRGLDPRPGRTSGDRRALLEAAIPNETPALSAPAPIHSAIDAAGYAAMVERALGYIAAGDIYQVNLSRRLHGRLPWPAFQVYQRLQTRYPAPMAAFLRDGRRATVSISPETFLHGDRHHIETRPIKGTRPRGSDPAADRRLAAALRASPKDRAENVMIVDVLRNDLGRIAATGTVQVPELTGLRTLPTVHHLESRIVAAPRSGVTPAEVLAACFPGGSVTGAPKIRAMEIIAELEPVARGGYCGAIAAIGFDGHLSSSIAIRTIYTEDDRFRFHVGGAVVADSDPADEYLETEHKAAALRQVLGGG